MVSSTTALVCAAWLEISADPNHRDLWLCDETILQRIRSLHPTLNVNHKAINCALLSVAGSHQELNILGLFHVVFKDICPYTTERRPVNYYYRYVKVEPSFPRIHSDVEDIIAKSFRLVQEREISFVDAEKNAKIANENQNKQNTEILESMNPESAIPGNPNPVTVSTAYPESTFPATVVLETLDAEKNARIANENKQNTEILESIN